MRRCFNYDAQTGLLTWKARDDVPSEVNTRFSGKPAGHEHTCTAGKTYLQVRVCGELHYGHRIAWTIEHGLIPEGMEIDHDDGDGLNNADHNLMLVTATANKRNMRRFRTNTSGATGVYLDRRRGTYSARVTENGKFRTLITGVSFERARTAREAHNTANGFNPRHGEVRPL